MRLKNEKATVSFHFLQREQKSKGGEPVTVPFTQAQFDSLCDSVENQPMPDLTDEKVFHQVRNGTLVPFLNIGRPNSRLLTGQFQVPYSGHSFLNSEKGKIPAESVNQRDFNFLLYLSDDGRIFIGAQYLGYYGGYETLRYGLVRHMPEKAGVRSYSFRRDLYDPSELRAKEVQINFMKPSTSFDKDNALTRRTTIVLKREGGTDTQFEEAVRKDLVPILTSDSDAEHRKSEIARVLADSGLMSVADDQIQNAVVIADVNGHEKRFHLVGDSAFATRFPLDVTYDKDGHPERVVTIEKMLERLDAEVIEQL